LDPWDLFGIDLFLLGNNISLLGLALVTWALFDLGMVPLGLIKPRSVITQNLTLLFGMI
jgi:hypothetical protein